MRTLITLAFVLLSCMSVIAQPPKGEAKKGMIFGEKTTAVGALNVNDLTENVSADKEANVKVKGKVVEVCTQMGCWLKMETAKGNIMVKMKDHSFFVPLDLNGKEIVVDGIAKSTVTPVSELKHYAEDAGKSKDEIAKIVEPKKEMVIQAKGILVL
jgi:hypothetical protein